MQDKRQQLVDLNAKIKAAKELFDEIKKELLQDIGQEAISVGDFLVTKVKRSVPKLNSNANVKELIEKHPDYVKFDVSKFAKENKSLIEDIVDYTTTESLRIVKKK